MQTEPPKCKRCWFQFSLRSLMIGVTLLAVPMGYVGWQAKIVTARKQLKLRYPFYAFQDTFWPFQKALLQGDSNKSPSLLRKLLGDETTPIIEVPLELSPSQIQEVRSLFPEATLTVDVLPSRRLAEPDRTPQRATQR